MTTRCNTSAFPQGRIVKTPSGEDYRDSKGAIFFADVGGLTKRELFAAMAMQGLCANAIPGDHHMPKNLAFEAVAYADAVLAELEKEQ